MHRWGSGLPATRADVQPNGGFINIEIALAARRQRCRLVTKVILLPWAKVTCE